MKRLQVGIVLVLPLLLSACLYGQCINGPCSFERERILNSIKAYGEYFEKPGMSKESWRADWMACGGMSNGNYATEVPSGSTTKVLLEDSKRKSTELRSCMQNKGYEYRSNP